MVLANTLMQWVRGGFCLLTCVLLAACDGEKQEFKSLPLPTASMAEHTSDYFSLGGKEWVLWNDGGGCKLTVGKADGIWLKPMAPCYFIKSPGRQEVQVFRLDKGSQLVAVVGTPTQKNRCGQEVQGVMLRNGNVTLSSYIMRGSVYCADQGLQNFQYGLFAKP
jgi:hypothetical protein